MPDSLTITEQRAAATQGWQLATVYDTRNFSVRTVLQGGCVFVLLGPRRRHLAWKTLSDSLGVLGNPHTHRAGHKRPCFGAEVVPAHLAKRLLRQQQSDHADGDTSSSSSGSGSGDGEGGDSPLVVVTWSSDTTLRFFDLSSSPSSPTAETSAAAAAVVEGGSAPLPPFATVAHPGFPIYCAAFSPASASSGGDGSSSSSLIIGGGDGQPQQHHHHDHAHDHGAGGGGGCCGGHAHEDEEEEEDGARTLLSYQF